MTLSGAAAGNYSISQPALSANITVKGLTVTGATAANKTYDKTTAATISGGSLSGILTGDVVTLATATSGTFASAGVGTGIAVTSAMTLSGTAAGNYSITQPALSANITAKNLTITAGNLTVTYGTPVATVTGSGSYSATGFVNDENSSVISGTVSYSTSYTATMNTGTNGLTITPVVSGLSATNYNFLAVNGSIVVTKADQTISWNNPAGIVYGTALVSAQLNAIVAGVTGGTTPGALTYTPAAGAVLSAGLSQSLTVEAAETSNYNAASKTVAINVTKSTITATADYGTKVYGSVDPALNYTISGTLATGDSFSGNPERSGGEDAGNYAITHGTLSLSSNYTLVFNNGNFDITKLPISIVADDLSKDEGQSDPALTFSSLPAAGTILANGLSVSFTGALSRIAGETAEKYPITIGTLANSNYVITFTGATFTISVATVVETATGSDVKITPYPNPFTDHLYFILELPSDARVRLEIFNSSGVRVSTIVDARINASDSILLEYIPENASTGMLFYRLTVNGKLIQTGKLIHK
jgi:hypothetical protein